jgi:type IV secretion system protein VirB4
MIFNFFKKEKDTSDILPYMWHITDHIIALKNSTMFASFELEGIPFETVNQVELNSFHRKLNLLWRNVNNENLSLWTHLIRLRDFFYPEGSFSLSFADKLNRKYRDKLLKEELYINRLFVSLIFNSRDVNSFQKIISTICASLSCYKVRLLGLYKEKGLIFSELNEYLNAIGTLSFMKLPLVQGPINYAVLVDRPIFGHEVIELRGAGSSRFGSILGIKEYPAMTRPGMLNDLLKAPFEFVLTQSYCMMSKNDSRRILSRKQNQMSNVGDRAYSQINELDQALDDLESNRMTMGQYHFNLMVLVHDISRLLEKTGLAQRCLAESGIISTREDLALESAYWSQFPGLFQHRPRSGYISSRNFSGLVPFHNYVKGSQKSFWGNSLLFLKTSGSSGFYFNFHVADLGNVFICGPSGSGKTVVQNFLLAQAQKYNPIIIFFDKDRGSEIFIRAMKGIYLTFQNQKHTGLAPLKALNIKDPLEKNFLITWLKSLFQHNLTREDEQTLEKGLLQLDNCSRAEKSLETLCYFLGDFGKDLNIWAKGGRNGWVFDNEEDCLKLDNMFFGFDLTDFLDNDEIRGPLILYLFQRIESFIDGRRIIIDIDEFWKAMLDRAFQDLILNKLKTFRKQNGLLILGTQSLSDVLNSSLSSTIIEQCPTKIFMPNVSASELEYVKGFGLSLREFELIRDELIPSSHRFLVKQGHDSVIVDLDLKGFEDELLILSGRTENINRLDEIRKNVGDDPKYWMPKLLNKVA